jgi:response regulator RpfG family c-di-GMP phosphodiesterase
MSTTATSRQLDKDVSFIPGSTVEKQHVLLVVDDEPYVLSMATDALKSAGYQCLTARSASQALITLNNPNYIFDLMISDVLMSGMSGIDLMKHACKIRPSLPVIVMSATAEIEIAVEAHRAGAADYLIKPFNHEDLLNAVTRTITRQATAELAGTHTNAHDWQTAARAFALALDARDKETEGHAERVVAFSVRLGQELGMSGSDLIALELGARLHDIGKIAVPDHVLKKPAPLTEDEWAKMRIHPVKGEQMVRAMGDRLPEAAALIVGQHHEQWNGEGYPLGLKGDQICLGARIFKVADTFDAITSDRVYRPAQPYQAALDEILKYKGIEFDPAVVDAFTRVDPTEWEHLRRQCLTHA